MREKIVTVIQMCSLIIIAVLALVCLALPFRFIGKLLLAVVVSYFIAFIAINFILGCESWDKRYWTESNSCLTLSQIITQTIGD